MGRHAPNAAGIGRSLRLYHGDGARIERMARFYRAFLGPGDLAFDIGAHVGDRTRVFRQIGARVIAVEPQPAAMRALRLIHGRDLDVTLVRSAVGAVAGRATLQINRANPTVSTLSEGFVAAAERASGWEGQVWDAQVPVRVATLDNLVERYGLPDFIKIDVEGFEDAALSGLSRPVGALSFEFTTLQRDVASRALNRAVELGAHRFAASLGESFALATDWSGAATIAEWLSDLPDAANSGDIYARWPDPRSGQSPSIRPQASWSRSKE